MTTLPKAPRYNVRRPEPKTVAPREATEPPAGETVPNDDAALEAIRNEGLTGRQLRMARRVAQRHGMTVDSDYDAVLQLRQAGIDPFQRKDVLSDQGDAPQAAPPAPRRPTLPTPAATATVPASAPMNTSLEERAGEIRKMQRDIARRRRKNLFLMAARLAFFVFLPTLLAGIYFFRLATPMYATTSQFVIQQASPQGGGGGLGSLFQGTSMANQQDSVSVQAYLSSEAAMKRLDQEYGFFAAFSGPDIDPLQRLEPGASMREAYKIYKRRVQISYDPTEGLVRMEVSAPTPALAHSFNEALIGYAEEQVDQMTKRLREDQMSGARRAYEEAEVGRTEALAVLTQLQSTAATLDPQAEGRALMGRIGALEQRRDELELEVASLLDNPRPNEARVEGVRSGIRRIDEQIQNLRAQITAVGVSGSSQTELNAQMREAEENYQVRLALVQEALAQMESARIEANRQVRYLSLSVPPTVPDSPSYPRGFEDTALAFMIFLAIYILMSLTAAVLREQLSS